LLLGVSIRCLDNINCLWEADVNAQPKEDSLPVFRFHRGD